MANETYTRVEVDARFDAFRQDVRADLAGRFAASDASLNSLKVEMVREIEGLRSEFREFKGTMRGLGIAITVAIPFLTILLNLAVAFLTRKP